MSAEDRKRYIKQQVNNLYTEEDRRENVYPQIVPRWDETPRSGLETEIFYHTTPRNFARSLEIALDHVMAKPFEHRIMFLFAWNEWERVRIWNRILNMEEDILKCRKRK